MFLGVLLARKKREQKKRQDESRKKTVSYIFFKGRIISMHVYV